MKRRALAFAAVLAASLTSCAKTSEDAMKPLIGLEWYSGYDDVKTELNSFTLLGERESSDDKIPQKMQDYADISLFEVNCDLTLCFTDSGLIGFNYHDVEQNQNYRTWHETLETKYGLPTEEGSGMASWYDDPLGKNTAVYLFNLEEGVQVSIYVTADSPDKSYEKEKEAYVPTPEIRTPIVPVSDEPERIAEGEEGTEAGANGGNTDSDAPTYTGAVRRGETADSSETVTETAADGDPVTTQTASKKTRQTTARTTAGRSAETTVTAADSTRSANTTEPAVQETEKSDDSRNFLINGLEFYRSPTTERSKMSAYTQLYEYRTEEPGQPWELIMEYENVPYEGKNCDAVLCFTSLGLVGINYFDSNTSDYNYWIKSLTEIYGAPDEVQYDYTAWSSDPVGEGTMIYVFALEDGVQISFFADDTGSELA